MVSDSRGKGLYHDDHKQFDTVRVFRTAYHNQAACSALNSGSILSLGHEKGEYQRFAREATASVWYQRFSQGCKKRMGQDWRPNRAISNELVHRLLAFCEELILQLVIFGCLSFSLLVTTGGLSYRLSL